MSTLLQLNNISFSTNERQIIHTISLSIHPGDFVVILGGNGSGKSTLLKLIHQTYLPTSGKLFFPENPKPTIVTLTQLISDSLFMDLTIAENAMLIESAFSKTKKINLPALSEYLSQFNSSLSNCLKTQVKKLSGGEQQMLAFALYLRHKPDLLLLDEHTSALDPKKSDAIMELTNQYLQKNKITCLMTTHSLSYAVKYGNRLMALSNGRVIFEANENEKSVLKADELMRKCY